MSGPVRRLRFDAEHRAGPGQEWLVTNGLGGFASGPISGGVTRRFHGLLVASLQAPLGRWLCLSHVGLTLLHGDRVFVVDSLDPPELERPDAALLTDFTVEAGLPIWRYAMPDIVLER